MTLERESLSLQRGSHRSWAVRVALLAVLGLILPGIAGVGPTTRADDLFGTDSFFARLYGDQKAARPGDIIHIIVTEQATATHAASRGLKRDAETSTGPGEGWLDFLKVLGYKGQHKSSDSATAVRTGSLTARVTVRVTELLPNGNLLVEGKHSVLVNRDVQTITLRGEVRPRDIGADNTVMSFDVANLLVEYQGSDPGRPGKRTGIISRLLNLLF